MLCITRFPIILLISIFVVVVSSSSDGNEDGASLRLLTKDERQVAKEAGYSYVDRLAQLEEDLFARGFHVKEGSPMSMMAKFKRPSQDVIDLSRNNMRFIETVRHLKNDLGLKEEEIERALGDGEFDSGCLPDPVCPRTQKYRTIDGSCNQQDIKLRNLGRAVSGYRRLLKPAYDDGVSSPRTFDSSGTELPSPRVISMNVFSDGDRPFSNITSLLMQFGQFVNHDLESTSTFTFPNGEGFSCCAPNNLPLDPSVLNSLVHCLPITIPIGDRQFSNFGKRCMNFVRSSTGPNRISCQLPFVSYAEQFNQNTQWLDGSAVYGSNNKTTNSLRNASNGMLDTFIDSNGHSLLPINSSCLGCLFIAGDSRVNELPQLTVVQTIWMREHNRIARVLNNLNPTWSSEIVFQEARRIVIAELQHITYNEFLPALLGVNGMLKNKLLRPLPGKQTFEQSKTRQATVSGPVSNEFATAAFRMGHSLVQSNVQFVVPNGQVGTYNLRNNFNNPGRFSDPLFFDNTIRGLVYQKSQKVDNKIADDLLLNLFMNAATDYRGQTNIGRLDLVALNIQRGRDHGLSSYNKYRQLCGLPKLVGPITSLPTSKPNDTISPYFDSWAVIALNYAYKNVDDIDLFVGGVLEINQQEDAVVGPTFMCIIAENFLKVKFEDRYFYEAGNGTNPYPFTPDQLVEIKKSSMSRILCDNNDGSVLTIQRNAFLVPSAQNQVANCKTGSIPNLNLDLWKERKENLGRPKKP